MATSQARSKSKLGSKKRESAAALPSAFQSEKVHGMADGVSDSASDVPEESDAAAFIRGYFLRAANCCCRSMRDFFSHVRK